MGNKILILGGSGLLGKELVSLFTQDTFYDVAAWSHSEVDVTDFKKLREGILEYCPNIIINAVAYNAVDACETSSEEYAKALLLNRDVPEALASISREIDATLVHFSTDYVFGLNEHKPGGYEECDTPIPGCAYARSKHEGERAVVAVGGRYYIIRLSRLFGLPGTGKKSFFEVMLSKVGAGEQVSAVSDEVSCFTYAPDLARATKSLVEDAPAYGYYHLSNPGSLSWYEGILLVLKVAKLDGKVIPVVGEVFKRPAPRPHFSVLRNTKRALLPGVEESVISFLKEKN
jgi:dTDP-4-dehydrorhamnose reductase